MLDVITRISCLAQKKIVTGQAKDFMLLRELTVPTAAAAPPITESHGGCTRRALGLRDHVLHSQETFLFLFHLSLGMLGNESWNLWRAFPAVPAVVGRGLEPLDN